MGEWHLIQPIQETEAHLVYKAQNAVCDEWDRRKEIYNRDIQPFLKHAKNELVLFQAMRDFNARIVAIKSPTKNHWSRVPKQRERYYKAIKNGWRPHDGKKMADYL